MGFLQRDAPMRALRSARQNRSHDMSQKVKRIRRFSDFQSLLSGKNKNTANGNTASENSVVFLLCWEISVQGVNKNMVGNCVLIFYGFLPALYFHLQCYRLQCFCFARFWVAFSDGSFFARLLLPDSFCGRLIFFQTFRSKKPDVRDVSAAILELEMDAPILWAPGFFVCQKKCQAHKIFGFRGCGYFQEWGGEGKCQFFFYGHREFLEKLLQKYSGNFAELFKHIREWPQYCRKVCWTKMVQTTILAKMALFRTGF